MFIPFKLNMKSNLIKIAQTNYPLIDVIKNRWSARSFTGDPIPQEQLNTILEAASWAASANNEQPWIYYYAHCNTTQFTSFWNCLNEGNHPWNKNASVLIIACIRKTFEKNFSAQPPRSTGK